MVALLKTQIDPELLKKEQEKKENEGEGKDYILKLIVYRLLEMSACVARSCCSLMPLTLASIRMTGYKVFTLLYCKAKFD